MMKMSAGFYIENDITGIIGKIKSYYFLHTSLRKIIGFICPLTVRSSMVEKARMMESNGRELAVRFFDRDLGENMSFTRKRHRADTAAESKINENAETDAKGRTMAEPANGLELYRNARNEEVTVFGHGARETGTRPFFEVYTVWYEGHLVDVAEKRSVAGEKARALRKAIPAGGKNVLTGDGRDVRTRLMAIVKHLTDENVSRMSVSDLRTAYETHDDRDKWHGHDLEVSDVFELAEERGIIEGRDGDE